MTLSPTPVQTPATRWTTVVPGLALSVAVAAVATLVNAHVPLLSALLLAILTGVALRNTGLLPSAADDGLKLAAKKVLRVGVVLLGARLSIPAVLSLGWGAIAVIVVTVTSVFLVTLLLGRLMGLPHASTMLTATGTAICGAAAVAGMSAVLRPDDEEDDVEDAAATAIASVALFGTLEILLLPLAVSALGLTVTRAGVWVGVSVHEVGQVVAAAGMISTAVLDVAVVAKLGRVVLLAPLVAIVGMLEARRSKRRHVEAAEVGEVLAGEPVRHPRSAAPVIPLFVVGFLVMVTLRSVLDGVLPAGLFSGINTVATFLLTMAMFAMGADVRLKQLARTGLPSLVLGAAAGAVSLIVSLAGVYLLVR